VWFWEDCFFEGGLTSAAVALASSTSIRIGLGLIPAPLRNAGLAAMEIAALARMFPGRFVPAAGHGVAHWMAQAGVKPASPMTLLREWVTATRALLHGDEVSVDGAYVHLERARLESPPVDVPPLLIGARGPRTLALAGEIADGLVLDAGLTPDGVAAAVATAAISPNQDVVVYLPCGATERAVRRLYLELNPDRGSGPERIAAGTVEDVADAIAAFAEAGATTVVLQPGCRDPDLETTLQLAASAHALYVRRDKLKSTGSGRRRTIEAAGR
jgi:5,10-methylenetetrahydromethanopterin reductase